MLVEAASSVGGAQVRPLHESCVRIGGVSLALAGVSSDDVRLSGELEIFRGDEENPDIKVNVEWVENLLPWQGCATFDSGALWALFRDGPEFIFDFTSPAFGPCPYKRLRTDRDFCSGQLIPNRQALGNHWPVFPLEYPADELLITNYLSSGLGVEVHGCGLVDSETGGHLFLGHSGAGKSTTTVLWKSLLNPEILSDDRIILRLHDGELWMYGTPWHGEAAFAMPGKARINRIFILEHGGQNEITPLTRSRAVGELFARSFPPFHSAQALDRTVAFLERVCDAVPCYEFQFVPDSSGVEAALGFHD
jgi:hypothetical protein